MLKEHAGAGIFARSGLMHTLPPCLGTTLWPAKSPKWMQAQMETAPLPLPLLPPSLPRTSPSRGPRRGQSPPTAPATTGRAGAQAEPTAGGVAAVGGGGRRRSSLAAAAAAKRHRRGCPRCPSHGRVPPPSPLGQESSLGGDANCWWWGSPSGGGGGESPVRGVAVTLPPLPPLPPLPRRGVGGAHRPRVWGGGWGGEFRAGVRVTRGQSAGMPPGESIISAALSFCTATSYSSLPPTTPLLAAAGAAGAAAALAAGLRLLPPGGALSSPSPLLER